MKLTEFASFTRRHIEVLGAITALLGAAVAMAHIVNVDWAPFATGLIASVAASAAVAAILGMRERMRKAHRPRVFISYTHRDSDMANKLAAQLEQLGAQPLLDRFELHVGENIRSAVDNLIQSADYFLILITPAFAESKWARSELEQAVATGKRILPVVFDRDAIPESISGLYYADLSTNPDKGFDDLARTLFKPRERA